MTTDSLLIGDRLYSRVQVAEAVLEGLLRTNGERIFPGFRYFDFRPAVMSRHGVRHPDGALLAPGSSQWWVVEVETHVHDVEGHVTPQLEALADGAYGREALRYLSRDSGFAQSDYEDLELWDPSFLLVVDHTTPFIRDAAASNAFQLLEIGVYRSEAAEYALRLDGPRPSVGDFGAKRGVDVEAHDGGGYTLLVPVAGRRFDGPPHTKIVVGDREVSVFPTGDSRALAVGMHPDELRSLLGEDVYLRVTYDGVLTTIDP